MTVPPTEAPPSKRSTACTTSSPRAARGPRSTKDASRTTIRVKRRGSRAQSSYSFILLSSLALALVTPASLPALLPGVRRPIDTRRDAAAVVTAPRLKGAIGLRRRTLPSNSLARARWQPTSGPRSRYLFVLTRERSGRRRRHPHDTGTGSAAICVGPGAKHRTLARRRPRRCSPFGRAQHFV